MKLTEKQKRFADYYIESGNATEAAIKAKYSKKTARAIATENLSKPIIREYIDKKLEEIASERIMGVTEALELLSSIARGEVTDEVIIPATDTRADGYIRTEKRVDVKDRIKAVESILKRFPNSRQEELKNILMEKQIERAEVEIEKIKGDNDPSGGKTIIVTGEEQMRAILNANKG